VNEHVVRQLALKVLAHHAGSGTDAAAVAAAARRAYDDLARAMTPLIGQVGVDTLSARAVHVAQRDYPWLAATREAEHVEGAFTQATVSLERQDPALAREAAAAVLATLTGLLVTFIGEPLTTGVLRKAWPDGFSDADGEETRA
jgi:hypothetical protein